MLKILVGSKSGVSPAIGKRDAFLGHLANGRDLAQSAHTRVLLVPHGCMLNFDLTYGAPCAMRVLLAFAIHTRVRTKLNAGHYINPQLGVLILIMHEREREREGEKE